MRLIQHPSFLDLKIFQMMSSRNHSTSIPSAMKPTFWGYVNELKHRQDLLKLKSLTEETALIWITKINII